MSSSLRPQFFCTRPNGTVTPLIAVDELPSHISIRGVSRALSPNDTQGMTSLGTVNARNQTYVVDGIPVAPMRAAAGNASAAAVAGAGASAGARSRDYDLQTSLVRILSDNSIPANQRLALHALIQQALAPNCAAAGGQSAASNWLVPAGGNGGRAGGSKQGPHLNAKKEYCSYWIRHGECDYQQQGCLYKHEMPTDPSMLEKLGLRDIPRWYREKYGVPSILPGGHNARANASNNQNWRDDAAEYGTAKSIQYPARLRYNGTTTPSSSDTEQASKQKTSNYMPAVQQNNGTPMMPGNARASYPMNPPRAPGSQRHGSRAVNNQQSIGAPGAAKRIDLLSFDPLPDYPTLDAMHGKMNGMTYPAGSGNNSTNSNNTKTPDEAHREGMVRNLQSLMPGSPDYLPNPLGANPSQQRSKKTQKGRRLYQPRSQIVVPADNQEIRDQASFGNAQHGNTYSSAASVASKGTNGSQVTSPIGVLGSSDPPTRVASPSTHSPTSLSSQSSPQAFYNKNKDRESSFLPGAIGSKRGYHRKRSTNTNSSEDDLFDFGAESGAGHGNGK